MTRDSAKKRAVAAFIKYAALGSPDAAKIRAMSDPEQMSDLLAVTEMFEQLDQEGRAHIGAAVRDIYMFAPFSSRSRNTSARVLSHAMSEYADERTVWRWLRYAKEVFAELRSDE